MIEREQWRYRAAAYYKDYRVEVVFHYGRRIGFVSWKQINNAWFGVVSPPEILEISRLWSDTSYCDSMSFQEFIDKIGVS